MALVKKKKRGLGGLRGGTPARASSLRPIPTPKKAPCLNGCPQNNDIRSFLTAIADGEKFGRNTEESYEEAWNILTQTNPFPAICGRICQHPCENKCNRKDKDQAVAINNVERFLGDFALQKGLKHQLSSEKKTQKIAIIGSGPAGLSCAFHLTKLGYPVTIFEALSKPGGMIRYGIPAYRLPSQIATNEINSVIEMGIELKTACSVGNDLSYEDIKNQFTSVIIGNSTHKGSKLEIPGGEANGVYSGIAFLNQINSGEKFDLYKTSDKSIKIEKSKKVVIYGGGDLARDIARLVVRWGAEATILYPLTDINVPQLDDLKKDGVEIQYLTSPQEIITDSDNDIKRIKKIKAVKTELNSKGIPPFLPTNDPAFELEADTLIHTFNDEYPKWETVEDLLKYPSDWLKIVGDLNRGRILAINTDCEINGKDKPAKDSATIIKSDKLLLDHYPDSKRNEETKEESLEQIKAGKTEIIATLDTADALAESKRCMSCGYCFDCEKCYTYCSESAVVKGKPGEFYTYKNELCTGCKKCAEVCPCGFLEMM